MVFPSLTYAGFGIPERARRHAWRVALVVLWSAMSGSEIAAQADRVDGGSFSISARGVRLGREQFSIRRAPSPDGTAFELRAESVLGERRTAVQQSVDSLGNPVHYSLEIRDGASVTVRAGGQRVRGRLVTQARRPTGESAREYMLAPGVIFLEPGFYHQFATLFLGRLPVSGKSVEMTVLSVLENNQQRLLLTLEANEDVVNIAGVSKTASRWRLDGGSAPVRSIWTDNEGRVLKVVIAAEFLEAVRDELPK